MIAGDKSSDKNAEKGSDKVSSGSDSSPSDDNLDPRLLKKLTNPKKAVKKSRNMNTTQLKLGIERATTEENSSLSPQKRVDTQAGKRGNMSNQSKNYDESQDSSPSPNRSKIYNFTK